MTRKEVFEQLYESAQKVYYEREARAVALLLLERLHGVNRTALTLDPDAKIGGRPTDIAGVCEDIVSGRPAQYITETAEFCGMDFTVREGVLIPRPETEELVRWVAQENKEETGTRILDIGTGSGAIAIALGVALPGSCVTGIDISEEALRVARENARKFDIGVEFSHADVFGDGIVERFAQGSFDIVVSNPPYIPARDRAAMHRNVTDHEPGEALFVPDDDPLVFYRRIVSLASGLLMPGGKLYFEVYERLAAETAALMRDGGFEDIEIRRDINGRDRMVRGVKRDR